MGKVIALDQLKQCENYLSSGETGAGRTASGTPRRAIERARYCNFLTKQRKMIK